MHRFNLNILLQEEVSRFVMYYNELHLSTTMSEAKKIFSFMMWHSICGAAYDRFTMNYNELSYLSMTTAEAKKRFSLIMWHNSICGVGLHKIVWIFIHKIFLIYKHDLGLKIDKEKCE
jgi:hypothetical protein